MKLVSDEQTFVLSVKSAHASTPSNFEPSDATCLPSTVPDTVMLHDTSALPLMSRVVSCSSRVVFTPSDLVWSLFKLF